MGGCSPRFAAFARATAACTAARSASGMGTSREVPATPLAGAFLPGLIAFQTAAIFLSHASATSLACAAGTSRKVRSVRTELTSTITGEPPSAVPGAAAVAWLGLGLGLGLG